MSYVNTPFPDCIAFGAQSEAVWMTNIVQTIGGSVVVNQNWEDNLHRFDVSFSVRTASDYAAVRTHFNEMRGRKNTFPFKDYLDFEVSQSQGLIRTLALVAPAADGTFYLFKKYGSANPYYRQITRPVSAIVVYRTRSATTSIITPTVTYSTGAVAITGHMSGDTYAWAGEFMVPCRYGTDSLPGAIINKQGGDDGELLVTCDSIPVIEERE